MRPVYLDNNATTQPDPRVAAAMVPTLTETFGNAHSQHRHGREAMALVDAARGDVAAVLGADPRDVVFTSGATEAINAVLAGVPTDRPEVVVSAVEHSAVHEAARNGRWTVRECPVLSDGTVDLVALRGLVGPRTGLVCVMHANNEIGTIQPVAEVAQIAHNAGALFLCDACQSFGKVPVPRGPDYIVASAHKLHGPKGVGMLWSRSGVHPAPFMRGGSQENGERAGTLNVPGIVGFGMAARLARLNAGECDRIARLRDDLWARIRAGFPTARLNGPEGQRRLPSNLSVYLPGVCPLALAEILAPVVSCSAASACKAGAHTSHVLRSIGAPDPTTGATVRLGLGRFTTPADVEVAAHVLTAASRSLAGVGCG